MEEEQNKTDIELKKQHRVNENNLNWKPCRKKNKPSIWKVNLKTDLEKEVAIAI